MVLLLVALLSHCWYGADTLEESPPAEPSADQAQEMETKAKLGEGWLPFCATTLEMALIPLACIMDTPYMLSCGSNGRNNSPYRENVFYRFTLHAVRTPISHYPRLASLLVIPAAVLLFVLSLVSAIACFLVALLLQPFVRVDGLTYAINLRLGCPQRHFLKGQ